MLLSLGNHFTRVYAPAGYPALTVNAGHRSSGEPLGLTFVGPYFADPMLFSVAAVFEAGR